MKFLNFDLALCSGPRLLLTTSLVLLVASIWFANLGYRDLIDPDEGRYAEIPREMIALNDWVAPRLNGIIYFEKPPLQYWATAFSYSLFGISNASARLWPAITGLLGVLWISFVTRRLFGNEAGWIAGCILGSTILWNAMSHFLTLDMGFSFFLTVALGAFLLANLEPTSPTKVRGWIVLCWFALALATLSKGLAALALPGLTLCAYGLIQRDWQPLFLALRPSGLTVYLTITIPWFVFAGIEYEGFSYFFFVHEHFDRFTTTVHNRDQPWWFFPAILPIAVLPWLVSTSRGFLAAFKIPHRRDKSFKPALFLALYGTTIIIFFSLSGSKLIPYILPAIPAFAILAAREIVDRGFPRFDALAAGLTGCAFLLLVINPGLAFDSDHPMTLLADYSPWLTGCSLIFICGAILSNYWRRSRIVSVFCLGLAASLALQLFGWGYQSLAPVNSSRDLAAAIAELAVKEQPVYELGRLDNSLPFYLAKTVQLVEYEGELQFGVELEHKRAAISLDKFALDWASTNKGIAIVSPAMYRELQSRRLPMTLIYQDSRRIAICRSCPRQVAGKQ